MTAKEKAKYLLNKFDSIIYTYQEHQKQVKQCALAAVCEIIQEYTTLPHFGELYSINIDYWEEVKQEIKKL
jgi:hypothetical protein